MHYVRVGLASANAI